MTAAYRKATVREARLRKAADQAAAERAAELTRMHQGGMSYGKIAEATGLSRSRVQQLVERSRQGTFTITGSEGSVTYPFNVRIEDM